MSSKLMPDAPVPALSVDTVGGERFELAAQSSGNFVMIVFYRGHHCPICKNYLQKLDRLVDQYQKARFTVIAVSMDGVDRARKAVDEWGLAKTTIGYGLTEEVARSWGLYISKAVNDTEIGIFCEPGLFWVRPDGRLYLVDISNMPWPRPDLEYLLSRTARAVEDGYPARGTYAG
jgi:peroxiredoxin